LEQRHYRIGCRRADLKEYIGRLFGNEAAFILEHPGEQGKNPDRILADPPECRQGGMTNPVVAVGEPVPNGLDRLFGSVQTERRKLEQSPVPYGGRIIRKRRHEHFRARVVKLIEAISLAGLVERLRWLARDAGNPNPVARLRPQQPSATARCDNHH
jgi:hypothetical protein